MDNIDYTGNAKYFKAVEYKRPVIIAVLGLLILSVGQPTAVVIGLVLMGVGGGLIAFQTLGRPSDAAIDEQFATKLQGLEERALRKLGIEREEFTLIDPVLARGYDYSGGSVRRGKDGADRSSQCEGVAFFFGEQELHSYKLQFSLVDQAESESTDVYFYRDVVSVSTNGHSTMLPLVGKDKPQVVQQEQLVLTTAGGTAVHCAVNSPDGSFGRDIQAARQLIRDKKLHAM
jgi:hypothetical protein